MKKYLFIVIFVGAFALTFSLLESRLIVFSTLSSSAHTRRTQTTQAQVLFVGDMMFDRYIRTVLTRSGSEHVLGGVTPLLEEADFNVGNLEGPITDNLSSSEGTKVGDPTNMRFTFSPTVRELLRDYTFGLVSIGNNHIRDYGVEGVTQTRSYLSGVGIEYVGDPTGESSEPVIRDVNGVRLAFVSYSDFVAGDAERARAAISSAGADAVIVLAHWGNEYETEPPLRIRELARTFAKAGADLIIGSHPHVIGAVEDIDGTRVYYSLGNFVFDQYWDPSVRCGLAVTASFVKTEGSTTIQYAETRVGMRNDGATVLGCS